MRPALWNPPVEASFAESTIIKRVRRAKLFVFLRLHRHELFDEAFQTELAATYAASSRGQPPIPPAQLALAVILQAYTRVSDDEVIEATLMDRRWQLALDCLDAETPPFSKGTFVAFRQRLIDHQLDRRLIERTVEVAAQHRGINPKQLRVALDSSPLWGAGRVEDTFNLLGHALRKALGVIAHQQGRGLAQVAAEADVPLLSATSLKAALDLDWDDPAAQTQALQIVLATLETVEAWSAQQALPAQTAESVAASVQIARQVQTQDVTTNAQGQPVLREGVAKERRISVEDATMRHGRKSKSQLIDGYKRHGVHDLDTPLVRAVGLTPANAPEASVTEDLATDLAEQKMSLSELHIDRAYLSSHWVCERSADLAIYCKAWPVRQSDYFSKTVFGWDWNTHHLRCPAGHGMPFALGEPVHFPEDVCAACTQRPQCTSSVHGRTVSVHPDEPLLQELRERQLTPQGRAKLRERVTVEHTLAHVGYWQSDQARYLGLRKNLFDLRRCAVVNNLHVIAHADAINAAN